MIDAWTPVWIVFALIGACALIAGVVAGARALLSEFSDAWRDGQ